MLRLNHSFWRALAADRARTIGGSSVSETIGLAAPLGLCANQIRPQLAALTPPI